MRYSGNCYFHCQVYLVLAGSLFLVEGEGGKLIQKKWLTEQFNRKPDQILVESKTKPEIADIVSNKIAHDNNGIKTGATKPTARKKIRRGRVIKKKITKKELANIIIHPKFDSFPIVKTSKKDKDSKGVELYSRMLEKLRNMVIKEERTEKELSHKDYMEILSKIQQKQNYDLTVIQSEINAKKLNEDYLKYDPKAKDIEANRLNDGFFQSTHKPMLKIRDDLLKKEETSVSLRNVQPPSPSHPAIRLVSWDQLVYHQ